MRQCCTSAAARYTFAAIVAFTLLGFVKSASADESFLFSLLRDLGFGKRRTVAQSIKGEELAHPPLAVWIATLDGKHMTRLTAQDGYRSPVFSDNSSAVWALRADALVKISAADGKIVSTMTLVGDVGVTGSLELVAPLKSGLCAVDGSGDAYRVDTNTGVTSRLGHLDGQERQTLFITARTCNGLQTYAGARERGPGGPDTDHVRLYQKRDAHPYAHPIPLQRELAIALSPAFAADCKRVVFVGAERW